MQPKNNQFYHLLALATAIIWGTTLVSTKVLLNHGLTAVEIMLYRFLIAYILLWILHPQSYKFGGWKDELLFVGVGFSGGTLYFIAENTALGITLASNVALIVTTAPIFTAILAHIAIKGERLNRNLIVGSLTALVGVTLVVFNGKFILKLNPLGDLLSLTAAISWALYSVILKRLDRKYDIFYITRKVFLYGIITLLPFFVFMPIHHDSKILFNEVVIGNLLFLGVIASSVCYIFWNLALKHIGTVRTSNYIYFIPIVTLITSVIVLNEPVTLFAIIGTIFILAGVYYVDQGFPKLIIHK